MFFPEGLVQVFVYGQPVSMRLSCDVCTRWCAMRWAKIP